MIKLGSLGNIVSGGTPDTQNPEYWDGGVLWVTPAEISQSTIIINDTARKISLAGLSSSGARLFPEGTVILSSRAPIGKVAIAGKEMCCNQGFKNIICSDSLFNKYLFYYLRSRTEYLNSLGRGATFKELSKSIVENIEIPLPPIDTQRKIAAILDKAQELIDLRKAQIEKLDDFLRSVFLDMFGDPVTNPKGWEVDRLDNVAEIVSGVAKGRKLVNQQTVFVPYMRVANVQDGHLVLDEIKQIEVLPSDVTKYALLDGDLLATEGGDPDKLGRCAIWEGQIKECIHQNHIFRIRLQTNKVMPEYVSFLMGSKHGKKYFLRSSKQTTGIASINSTQLKSFPAFLPPLPLQQQFAAIVEKTEQQKTLMQQSLTEMENNFNSLMQRAFRGELF
ncbi:MAG: restriction endonuclease subunit S [Desulfuromonadaceae bacterium]|nr:restriction endonuclease subunit S [Desulfuromonadaceae bacterium]